MKKFLMTLTAKVKPIVVAIVAAASITLASCSKDPYDKVIDFVKDATEQVKNAESMKEIDNISRELESKIKKWSAENEDIDIEQISEAQQKEMSEASMEFGRTLVKNITKQVKNAKCPEDVSNIISEFQSNEYIKFAILFREQELQEEYKELGKVVVKNITRQVKNAKSREEVFNIISEFQSSEYIKLANLFQEQDLQEEYKELGEAIQEAWAKFN